MHEGSRNRWCAQIARGEAGAVWAHHRFRLPSWLFDPCMKEAGIGGAPKLRVVKLAQLAKSAGVDGVVASVQEAKAIRKACGTDFLIATPGVRPKNSPVESKSEDQARKATPTEAIRAGADFLIVGRPILAAPDPRGAAQSIVDEIAAAK